MAFDNIGFRFFPSFFVCVNAVLESFILLDLQVARFRIEMLNGCGWNGVHVGEYRCLMRYYRSSFVATFYNKRNYK